MKEQIKCKDCRFSVKNVYEKPREYNLICMATPFTHGKRNEDWCFMGKEKEEVQEEPAKPEPAKPEPEIIIEPGHAYEFNNGALIYVVEIVDSSPDELHGDYLHRDNKFLSYLDDMKSMFPGRSSRFIKREISLDEWFERTRDHNPGWQVGGYYKSQRRTAYVHIVGEEFGKNFPAHSFNSLMKNSVSWSNNEFKIYKFLPITKAQWDARLAEEKPNEGTKENNRNIV